MDAIFLHFISLVFRFFFSDESLGPVSSERKFLLERRKIKKQLALWVLAGTARTRRRLMSCSSSRTISDDGCVFVSFLSGQPLSAADFSMSSSQQRRSIGADAADGVVFGADRLAPINSNGAHWSASFSILSWAHKRNHPNKDNRPPYINAWGHQHKSQSTSTV